MGDFLEALKEMAGGWSAVKQIDKTGYDFREQRAAQQAARDQELQNYQQQNEKYLLGQAEDVAAGQEGEYNPEEFASQIPGQIDQARKLWMAKQLPGRVSERKSSIAANNAYYKQQQDLLKGQQREKEIALRGDEAEALAKVKNGLPLSATDDAKIKAAEKRTGMSIQGMLTAVEKREAGATARDANGGGSDEKPLYRYTTTNPETGEGGTVLVFPGGREEFKVAAPTVTMRDTASMAMTIQDSLQQMKDAAEAGVVDGPIVGRLSKLWQMAYPSGNEGLFDTAADQLVDIVYTKSGKQINKQEMDILRNMTPNRAKGDVEYQIERFEKYADGLLRRYGKAPMGGGGGAGRPKVRMVKYKGQLVPLSSLPPELQARVPR